MYENHQYFIFIYQKSVAFTFPVLMPLERNYNLARAMDTNKCDICDFISTNKQSLKQHMKRAHDYVKVKNDECDICAKTFVSKYYLQRHKRIDHNLYTNNERCNLCNKTFLSDIGFKDHVKRFHTVQLEVKCKICDKTYAQESNLNLHVQTIHKGERKYVTNAIRLLMIKVYSEDM